MGRNEVFGKDISLTQKYIMAAITGSIFILIILVVYLLVVLGYPYGEYIMGGKYKTLPEKMKPVWIVAIAIQLIMMLTLLQAGNIININISGKVVTVLAYIFAIYISLSVLANLASRSKKERLLMTPLSLVIAICYWITILV